MSVVIQKNDPNRTKKLMISALVERYQKEHPEEWSLFLAGQKQLRASLHNDRGMSKDGLLQNVMSVPVKLMMKLDLVCVNDVGVTIEKDPLIWPWFKESYPEFMVPRHL
jgi:hypothetical protein